MNFPSSPTLDQTYTLGSKTWVWNGSAWDLQSAAPNNLTLDYVQLNTSATVADAVGRIHWDADQGTADLGLGGGNIVQRLGQSLVAYVTNAEATTITKGQAVYLFSAVGDRASVKLAYNTGDATSAKTLGIAAEDIASGASGFIMCQGVAYKMNTAAYTSGDSLYLGATAGALTATKPYAPNHLVYIGTVEKANAGNGQIYVRVQNGYEMDELHNVSAQSPTTGQTLVYNSSTSLWEKNTVSLTAGVNGTLPVANGGTGVTTSTGTGNVVLSASPTLTGDITLNAQGDLRFADADSSNWVAFQAPATIASNVTWTLPAADGTSAQVLSTNGSGTLSWSTASGSSQWTTTGSDIYYNTGNVAVGSTSVVASTGKAYQLGSNVLLQNVVNSQLMLSQNAVYDSTWKYITANRAAAIRFGSQNDGEITFHYSNAVGTAGGALSNWDSNKSMVITQTGQVLVGPTSAQSGGCNFQVSQGITFPATQSASSDANTLDDYEEGTWTPTDASGAGLSLTVSGTPSYTKIGRMVTVMALVTYPSTANGSNQLLGGLPFTSASAANGGDPGGFLRYSNYGSGLWVEVLASSTTFRCWTLAGANITNANASTKRFDFVMTYFV